MRMLSRTLVAAVCAFGASFGCFGQTAQSTITNVIQISCYRPYEKYTAKEGEKILAYLSLIGFEDVKSFQHSKGLIVDGVAGPETCKAATKELFSREMLKAQSSVKPIALIIAQSAGELHLSISNKTDHIVVLQGFGSLVSTVGAQRDLSLPVTAATSGQSRTGALFRGGTETEVRIHVPLTIEPRGVIERPLRTKSVGDGVSELRARFVAVINTNQVEMIEAEPLKLSQLIEFE